MPERTMLLRTAYCLDKLRLDQGIGAPTIYKRICENQYERLGLVCMSFESVRDLFRSRESPGVDPPLINDPSNDPPWLFALELEYPSSTDAFFHPAFDLLWGQVESRRYWDERAERVPSEWIQEALASGRDELAAEWSAHNEALSKRGRPKAMPQVPPLQAARLALLRLPASVHGPLFKSIRRGAYVARMLRDPRVEVEACTREVSLDSLAALMALLLEAETISDWDRFHVVRRALRKMLPQVAALNECRRIATTLTSEVIRFAHARAPYQSLEDRFYIGKPRSWLFHLAPPLGRHFEEIFGHPPE